MPLVCTVLCTGASHRLQRRQSAAVFSTLGRGVRQVSRMACEDGQALGGSWCDSLALHTSESLAALAVLCTRWHSTYESARRVAIGGVGQCARLGFLDFLRQHPDLLALLHTSHQWSYECSFPSSLLAVRQGTCSGGVVLHQHWW